jgi:hypothetical protein
MNKDHRIVWTNFNPPLGVALDKHAPRIGSAVREVLWNDVHVAAYIFEVPADKPQYPSGLKYRAVSLLRAEFRPASFPTADAALSYMERQHHTLEKAPDPLPNRERIRSRPRNGEPLTGVDTLTAIKSWQKFYHASPKRFRHGDILTGGHEGGFGVRGSGVYMTTTPVPHWSIQSAIPSESEKDWYVYEVEPLGPVKYRSNNGEYLTISAKVLRNMGRALPILEKAKNNSDTVWDEIALNPSKERKRWESRQRPSAKRVATRWAAA